MVCSDFVMKVPTWMHFYCIDTATQAALGCRLGFAPVSGIYCMLAGGRHVGFSAFVMKVHGKSTCMISMASTLTLPPGCRLGCAPVSGMYSVLAGGSLVVGMCSVQLS